MSCQESVRVHVPRYLSKVIAYSDGFIFKQELVIQHKHHFHVCNSEKCDCYDLYLNKELFKMSSDSIRLNVALES